jgi:hypothetical protein
MKKNYVKPATLVVRIQQQGSLLNASPTVTDIKTNTGITGGTSGSSQNGRSRTGNVWEDDDEDEDMY